MLASDEVISIDDCKFIIGLLLKLKEVGGNFRGRIVRAKYKYGINNKKISLHTLFTAVANIPATVRQSEVAVVRIQDIEIKVQVFCERKIILEDPSNVEFAKRTECHKIVFITVF